MTGLEKIESESQGKTEFDGFTKYEKKMLNKTKRKSIILWCQMSAGVFEFHEMLGIMSRRRFMYRIYMSYVYKYRCMYVCMSDEKVKK